MRPRLAPMTKLSPFYLLFLATHFFYSLLSILSYFLRTVHFPSRAAKGKLPLSTVVDDPFSRLELAAARLKKLPLHLAFVIRDDALSLDLADFPKLILWCMAANIRCVTLYDADGFLKRQQRRLMELTVIEQQKWRGTLSLATTTAPTATAPAKLPDPSAEAVHLGSTRVHVLSLDDGQPAIVRTAQRLCEQICVAGGASSPPPDMPTVDTALACGLPEVDVAVQLGGASVAAGLLPWHTRFTETFYTPQNVRQMDVETFIAALRQFSGCVQRWGT